MAYSATVRKVMIASPGDVATERQIAREVIHEWNAIHSEDTGAVLLPVGWETHSSPLLGERAQSIINKQVLHGCDLLVAIFWTRLGSPTGDFPSGTVEEIREHLAQGKQAMIYFSSAPVHPDSVDEEQYSALKAFRSECFEMGLVEAYDSLTEFKEKFTRQLAQTVIRHFKLPMVSQPEEVRADVHTPDVSAEARELLIAAADDPNGKVFNVKTFGKSAIQTNNLRFGEGADARERARWENALAELVELRFLEVRGWRQEVYSITHAGYEAADRLRSI